MTTLTSTGTRMQRGRRDLTLIREEGGRAQDGCHQFHRH